MAEQDLPENPVPQDRSVEAQPKLLARLRKRSASKSSAQHPAVPPVSTEIVASDLAVVRQQVEGARMTRRAALRKMGITAGIGVAYMLTIDDLARACLNRLHEQEFTREVADILLAEIGDAGVAVAATTSESYGYGYGYGLR